ncbi:ANR family transcriptional regulator [Escherichia coli]|nr:ANR family transcriptional regulator [Escherichia coli]
MEKKSKISFYYTFAYQASKAEALCDYESAEYLWRKASAYCSKQENIEWITKRINFCKKHHKNN